MMTLANRSTCCLCLWLRLLDRSLEGGGAWGIGVKSARNDLEREKEREMREDLCARRFFTEGNIRWFWARVKASLWLTKQRYLACAGEVIFGDLGIFHSACTGGLVQGVCARTGGLVQGVCAVHIGSNEVQYSVIWTCSESTVRYLVIRAHLCNRLCCTFR